MSLLEKYSTIHQGIDQAREETTKVQEMIEQTQMEVDRLRQERASMEAAIQLAESECQALTGKTEQALSEVETLQSKKTLVTSELELSKRKLDAAKKMAHDYRHEFLRETRAFRAACKTLAVRAGLLRSTPRAPLRAYAMVQATHPERGGERHLEMLEFAEQDDENDAEYDEILKGAIENLTAAQESLSKAEEDRECLTGKKTDLLEKAETRTNRKRQLHSQMTRIQADVEELEASIAAVQEEITEAKEMGANFEKGTSVVPLN
jgi:chromosome segregation ATPase